MRTVGSELGGMLGAPFKPFGGLPKVASIVVGIVSLTATASGAVWATITGLLPIPWLVVALLSILLIYFAAVVLVQAGRASCRPWFVVSDLQIEDNGRLFFVSVRNGPVDAWIKGFVGPFNDPRGGAHTQRAWEGHWRAEGPEFDGKLRGGEPLRGYGLVLVHENPKSPCTIVQRT